MTPLLLAIAATISWQPLDSTLLGGYSVYVARQPGQYFTNYMVPNPPMTFNEEPGIYYAAVRAVDINGLAGEISEEVMFVVANDENTQVIELEWEPNLEPNVVSYRVYVEKNGVLVGVHLVPDGTVLILEQSFTPGAVYTATVSAVTSTGQESEKSVTVSWKLHEPVLDVAVQ